MLLMIRQFLILLLSLVQFSLPGQMIDNFRDNYYRTDPQQQYLYMIYLDSITSPGEIINGKEYLPYSVHSRTTPLLFSGEILNTVLKFNNREYNNVRLQYDTYLDEFIYTDTSRFIDNQYPRIALNRDLINGIDIIFRGDTMKFRYLKFRGTTGDNPGEGYYEVVYNGNSAFIIKHHSSMYTYHALNEYKYSPEKYVFIGGKSFRIKNLKDFLPVFGEHSPEIDEFIKRSNIRLRKAQKSDIVRILVYFDSLNKSQAGL